MSTQTELTFREPETVTIGPVSLVCDSMKLSAYKTVTEETTVSGADTVTNCGRRALKLTFTGRVHDDCDPMELLLYLYNLMPSNSGFTVTYRGLTFSSCHIQAMTAEDRGEEWIPVSVTLISPDNIALAEVSE